MSTSVHHRVARIKPAHVKLAAAARPGLDPGSRATGRRVALGPGAKAGTPSVCEVRPECWLHSADGGEKVSTQTIAGGECDLYRLTNQKGRREVCVSQDERRLPLLYTVWQRGSGKEVRTYYPYWTSGLALLDDFFEPDPATKLEHLSYDDYVRRAAKERIGPVPPFFGSLLHGAK